MFHKSGVSQLDAETWGIEAAPGGVLIRVYVSPRASSNKVIGAHNGEVKIALTAPPVEGAANKALVEFLAKALSLPKSSISITSGETSRHKTLRADGIGVDATAQKLGLAS